MVIFDFDDYKKWVNSWIETQPKGGHGQLRQLSIYLGINSVVMSQVFRGKRDLSMDQAFKSTQFMGLTELERDFFLLLVQKSKANSIELKELLRKKISNLKEQAQELKNRVNHQSLSDEDKSIFYSHWHYSAVRLGLSIPKLSSISAVSEYLSLDRDLVSKIVEFLLKHNLVVEGNGRFDLGHPITHVGHDSPFVRSHHNNWRIKGLLALERVSDTDLHYTGPMVLSEESAQEVRKLLLELIENATKKVKESKSEVLRCMNIDWFTVGKSR